MRALSEGLPKVASDPRASEPGRQQMQYGAYLSAVAFASTGSALHHKICHALGGGFDLPHAETHAVMLPYVLAFNAPEARSAAERIAEAFGAEDPVEGLMALRAAIGAPGALRDHGLEEADLDRAAELVLAAAPSSNPRPVSASDARRIVRAAWAGEDPAALSR